MNEAKLKKILAQTGKLKRKEITQAEDYALTRGIPLEEALSFLDFIDVKTLGKCLSEYYKMPYFPLLETMPSQELKRQVPLTIAEKCEIFPVNCSTDENILTLAINNPEDIGIRDFLERNAFAPYTITFAVASKAEIREAIDAFYKGRHPRKKLELPENFTILPGEAGKENTAEVRTKESNGKRLLLLEPEMRHARAIRVLLKAEGCQEVEWVSSLPALKEVLEEKTFDRLIVNAQAFKLAESVWQKIAASVKLPEISWLSDVGALLMDQAYSYHDMSAALVSVIAFFVKMTLKNNQRHLSDVLERVKYCKLLALKLGLAEVAVDGVVLAAWASAPGIRKIFFEGVQTPYRLEEILDFEPFLIKPQRRFETTIFALVSLYQEMIKIRPEVREDVSALREALSERMTFQQDVRVIETFLRLLADDRFLRKVEGLAGRVLIVDPEKTLNADIILRLGNDGFQVETASSAGRALEMIGKSKIDIILSEVDLPDTDGLEFCKTLKADPDTQGILFFFLTGNKSQGLAARSLEAGADDFLNKPVDVALLSLKIRRLLAAERPDEGARGVSGSLQEMNFTDLIQILSAGNKNIVVLLQKNGDTGKVFVRQGEIIHAEAEDRTGEEAFYRIMGWPDASFRVIPCKNFPEETIHASAMLLLMEGARLRDEASLAEAGRELI